MESINFRKNSQKVNGSLLIAKLKDTNTTKITKTILNKRTKTNFKVISPRTKTARLAIAVLIIGMAISLIPTAYHPNVYAKSFFHHSHKDKTKDMSPGDTQTIKGGKGDVTLEQGTSANINGKHFVCHHESSNHSHHHSLHVHCSNNDNSDDSS